MQVKGSYQFRVTRNSELVVDEEEVENLARQYILARSLGPTRDLPAEEMDEVLRRFRHYGQQRRTE